MHRWVGLVFRMAAGNRIEDPLKGESRAATGRRKEDHRTQSGQAAVQDGAIHPCGKAIVLDTACERFHVPVGPMIKPIGDISPEGDGCCRESANCYPGRVGSGNRRDPIKSERNSTGILHG